MFPINKLCPALQQAGEMPNPTKKAESKSIWHEKNHEVYDVQQIDWALFLYLKFHILDYFIPKIKQRPQ